MSTGDGTSRQPCAVLPADLVRSYADGRLDGTRAWSVEAHLPGCAACRAVLDAGLDPARLAAGRAVVLARASLPAPGPAARLLRRCGVPDHVATLLAATPSLRRSWLAGVVLVLATVTAAAQVASAAMVSAGMAGMPRHGLPAGSWAPLLPFVAVAPLLPLAAVAAAFSPALDPAHRLAAAAPVSAVWLLCIRSVAVVTTTLVPVAAAALVLPGPWWLAVALLLPSLAVCAVAVALATAAGPVRAVAGAAAGWVAVVAGLATGFGPQAGTAGALGPVAQACAAVVLAGAAGVVALRRDRIEYGGIA